MGRARAPRRCLQSGMTSAAPLTPCPALRPAPGNAFRRTLHTCCWVGAVALAPALAWAQADGSTARPTPKVEHIVHEDGGSRVQELRVGGQTRAIEVQTKSDLPAYHINPPSAVQGAAHPDGQRTGNAGAAGRTTWRFLQF